MQRIPSNKADFELLFKEHYPGMVMLANKFVQDLDAAKDIAQQVFINIHEKRDVLSISGSIKGYLLQATKNGALNYIKQKKNQEKHKSNYSSLNPDIAEDNDQLELDQLNEAIGKLIETLPPKCQLIFKMNRFEGKKNKAIAEELDISIRTVETQISKALKILRENIPKELLGLFLLLFESF